MQFFRLPDQLYFHSILHQIYFWVASSVSIVLYIKTLCFARTQQSATSARLKTLSRTFTAIAVSWIVCEAPNLILAVLEYPFWAASNCNDFNFHFCNLFYCEETDRTLQMAEAATKMAKNSFAIVNTVLLVVLLRPLQQPLIRVLSFAGCQKKSKVNEKIPKAFASKKNSK